MPFPSMKKLPLLGYRYADYYRQAKIQEALYEFLTQQYEMARVQEAKELPTVRIMDVAIPPERKNGPIRSLIVSLSIIGGLILATLWIFGRESWERLPEEDQRRMLFAEVKDAFRRRLPGRQNRRK